MIRIGLTREEKTPVDNRVALTPNQCKWIANHFPGITIVVQPSLNRCFSDDEYKNAGIQIQENLLDCDILLGIKEVPVRNLLPGKTYFIFSHTKKKQPQNQQLIKAFLANKNTLIDYECLVHDDGQRILGFGFFAGVVGAHNGLLAYGKKTRQFLFSPVNECHDLKELAETYFGTKLPPVKIVVTGSGRVAAGILEVMGMLGIKDVTPEEFLITEYKYPVYTQLKAGELYLRASDKIYNRENFHQHPEQYECKFLPFVTAADILINGIYWDVNMASLFSWADIQKDNFRIKVIADVTNDWHGSIPCNLGDSAIDHPVYGVNKFTCQKTAPYLEDTIDMMCVSNLPNELPRDASRYFGEQLIKYVLPELLLPSSELVERATIVKQGQLTPLFEYLKDYAEGNK
jgi:alanine dehydrogenase